MDSDFRQGPGPSQHEARQNGQVHNEDLIIHVKAPVDFPYHAWLAFSSQMYADVVKRLREHGLAPAEDRKAKT